MWELCGSEAIVLDYEKYGFSIEDEVNLPSTS